MVQSDERVDRLIRFVDSTDPRHGPTRPRLADRSNRV